MTTRKYNLEAHCDECGRTLNLQYWAEKVDLLTIDPMWDTYYFTYDHLSDDQTPMRISTPGGRAYEFGGCCYRAACDAIGAATTTVKP